MKLCKDCKHYTFQREANDVHHLCNRFNVKHIDLVTGVQSFTGVIDAYEMREYKCGKEAEYWEAK